MSERQTRPTAAPSQTLSDIVTVTHFTRENCVFTEKNGFLGLRAVLDHPTDPSQSSELVLDRIFLSRAFPFDKPFEYISVFDKEKREIGFIRSLANDFDEETCGRLMRELEETYYRPMIRRILSVKDQRGLSHWQTECDCGTLEFTLQDIYRSLRKITTADGHDRILITDVYGNRYEIPDVEALDRQSYRRIELYL